MNERRIYDPGDDVLGGFTSVDGTIEFFNRVNAILDPGFTVLDIGAGRGSWYYLDKCEYRKKLRTIRGKVKEYICADVDAVVMGNPTSDKNVVIRGNHVPLEDQSVDIIISDFVLEHIVDVASFKHEIFRLLKPGGYFCARTPHSMHYVSLAARLIRNTRHAKLLSFVQPTRHTEDVFPTAYKLNTLRQVRKIFFDWENYTYLYTSEPRYFFGSRLFYRLCAVLHAVAPRALTGNLFIFLRKSAASR
jgi:ubiquinone/menaquinone biosynthesis C-methylase UbiE